MGLFYAFLNIIIMDERIESNFALKNGPGKVCGSNVDRWKRSIRVELFSLVVSHFPVCSSLEAGAGRDFAARKLPSFPQALQHAKAKNTSNRRRLHTIRVIDVRSKTNSTTQKRM